MLRVVQVGVDFLHLRLEVAISQAAMSIKLIYTVGNHVTFYTYIRTERVSIFVIFFFNAE